MKPEPNSKSVPDFTGTLVRPPWFYRQWMLAGNPAYFFRRLVDDYGDFIHYRGLFKFYLVNHPSLVKQVLMDTHKSFDKKTIIYQRLVRVFGNGLVVSEGNDWKRQRKMMQPMFGPITVRNFFDGMHGAVGDMLDRWKVEFANQRIFDIAYEMEQLTLRVTGEALFSEGFTQQADRIAEWNARINFYCAKPPLPIIRAFWFPSTVNRRLKRTLHEFHEFVGQMIANRRKSGPKNDLLSILLDARHEDDGQPLSDLEVREQVLAMILGGHETSSRALTWVWYELDRHPEVREKLNAELDAVLGSEKPSLEHLPHLKYTKMVIDECMRLHPPFWFENRNVMQDVELGGEVIPKGSLVIFTRYTVHRHRDFWRQPDEFIPERQDPDQPENLRSTYAQLPFGGGPRICIGINFAVMELVLTVAAICQQFEVNVAKENNHVMAAKMTMFPRHGVKVQLKPRQHSPSGQA